MAESGFTFGGVPYNAIGANDANNVFDSSLVVANPDGSVLERLEHVQSTLAGREPVTFEASESPTVDEDGGRFAVSLSVVDTNSGPIASASIDITGVTITLERSTAGGAFATAGVTQPTGATKANGLVELEFDIDATEWGVGDRYRLKLGGVTASVSGITYYSGTKTWSGLIVEDVDVKTTVDDIDADLGEPNDAAVDPAGATGTAHAKIRGVGEDTRYIADADPGAGTAGSLAARIGQTGDAASESGALLPRVSAVLDDTNTLRDAAISGPTADTIEDQLFVGAGEQLRKFVALTGGRSIAAGKSLVNAIGHDGTTDQNEGLSALVRAPAADASANTHARDVIGNKSDVASTASTASIVALQRALVDVYAAVTGTADSGTTTTMVDAALTQADANYWRGMQLVFTSGPNDGQGRPIVDFDPATDTITVAPAFTQAVAAGHAYAIVSIETLAHAHVALNATGLTITGESLADQVFIGAGEQLRTFIAKTGGTPVAAGKSLTNAIGHDGTTNLEQGLTLILGADNANNAGASSQVTANEDGTVLERLEQIQEATNRGTGTALAANKSLVDALGSDGTTVTDSDVTVLGAIGANNANNAFDSSNVVANRDGSALERLEAVVQGVGTVTGPTNATVNCSASATTTLVEVTSITTPTDVTVSLNLKNLTVDATIRVQEKVYNGTSDEYQIVDPTKTFVAAGSVDAVRVEFTAQSDYKIELVTGAEGAARDVYVKHTRQVRG